MNDTDNVANVPGTEWKVGEWLCDMRDRAVGGLLPPGLAAHVQVLDCVKVPYTAGCDVIDVPTHYVVIELVNNWPVKVRHVCKLSTAGYSSAVPVPCADILSSVRTRAMLVVLVEADEDSVIQCGYSYDERHLMLMRLKLK